MLISQMVEKHHKDTKPYIKTLYEYYKKYSALYKEVYMRKTPNRFNRRRVLQVYILLEYYDNKARIIEVFFKKRSAQVKKQRCERLMEPITKHDKNVVTYHIIKKSIKDSYPVQHLFKYYHKDILNELFEN